MTKVPEAAEGPQPWTDKKMGGWVGWRKTAQACARGTDQSDTGVHGLDVMRSIL